MSGQFWIPFKRDYIFGCRYFDSNFLPRAVAVDMKQGLGKNQTPNYLTPLNHSTATAAQGTGCFADNTGSWHILPPRHKIPNSYRAVGRVAQAAREYILLPYSKRAKTVHFLEQNLSALNYFSCVSIISSVPGQPARVSFFIALCPRPVHSSSQSPSSAAPHKPPV